MSGDIMIKIILLHFVALMITFFLGMMTLEHTIIQKCLKGLYVMVVVSIMTLSVYVIINA